MSSIGVVPRYTRIGNVWKYQFPHSLPIHYVSMLVSDFWIFASLIVRNISLYFQFAYFLKVKIICTLSTDHFLCPFFYCCIEHFKKLFIYFARASCRAQFHEPWDGDLSHPGTYVDHFLIDLYKHFIYYQNEPLVM